MSFPTQIAVWLTGHGFLPDSVVRLGVRPLIKRRHREITPGDLDDLAKKKSAFMDAMARSPVALVPELADLQHNEVPVKFFRMREFYFCYCEARFTERVISDVQILLTKPGNRRSPIPSYLVA